MAEDGFKLSPFKKADDKPNPVSDIEQMSVEQLLELRGEIDRRLPSGLLADMNLEHELVIQYHKVSVLQDKVLGDASCPPNQAAQVSNSMAAVLDRLVKMQSETFTSERFKSIESILIKTLNTLPEETARMFIDRYEEELSK